MLKHSMFSNSYLNYRNNSTGKNLPEAKFEGSLAVLPKRHEGKALVICRKTSRTWWESGWQFNR